MWTPDSWRTREAPQQATYAEPERRDAVLSQIARLPPLVAPGSVEHLKRLLTDVAQGRRFLLQGGDCAERFEECDERTIADKLKILLQMSVVLTHGLRQPIVRVGRLAGQYAKPRSSDTETVDGVTLPAYRGDMVNGFAPTIEARRPDPERLLRAYFHAAATLNYVRALIEAGFADLHHPEGWNLGFIRESNRQREYSEVVARILDAISFIEACGSDLAAALGRIDFFTSHEALILPYEEALTRQETAPGSRFPAPGRGRPHLEPASGSREPRHYNLGAHLLWVGDRTRALDGAHVEYLRGLANPIGVKVGPTCAPEELARLVERLNPENEAGRLILITRLGADRVADLLPPLIAAVRDLGARVVWSCDPMHGNTIRLGGVKTRLFDRILEELQASFAVHAAQGTCLGGVHFELTGDDVTECLGGARRLGPADLKVKYATYCDPRLNEEQSLEMAFLIGQRVARGP
jgi:3-deoxy-7-phosphoheptulonate synthase